MKHSTEIHCQALTCKNNNQGVCGAETVHMHGCTPDSDNIFACSEFVEQELEGGVE